MKNLAINIPTINDATSFYRAAYPLGQLRQRCKFLNGLSISSWSEATLRVSDGVFFQRPFLDDHRGAMEMAIEVGRRVWVDYDDNLLGVPTDNPTYSKYMTKKIQDNIRWILKNADVVTVSTNFLKSIYEPYAKNIKVVRNAIDMDLKFAKERSPLPERKKIIAWRGSHTHHRDVFSFAPEILDASLDQKNEAWSWHFMGDNLWFVTDGMPHLRTFLTGAMGPIEYHRHIHSLAPTAIQVPLADSPFNRCKSNIAWIEGTYAGAVAIVPDWEEWKNPGAITYKNQAEYKQALYAVMNGEVDVDAHVKQSWEYIQDNLTLARTTETRIEVLMELFQCDRKDLGVE